MAEYSMIFGNSNNFVAIWADPDANLENGKFYVSTKNSLSIIDLEGKQLHAAYNNLIGVDVVDLNVTGD